MEKTQSSVAVQIAGDEYKIRGEEPEDTIQDIAGYVNGKISEISGGVTSRERYRSAILAAVNIAGELFRARKDLEDRSNSLSEINTQAKELVEKLESKFD